MSKILQEFLVFVAKQAYSAIFGGILLFFLLTTHFWYPHDFAFSRYDFLFCVAFLTQFFLLFFRLEEWKEFRVILLYHLVGTVMEIFKVQMGSWIYPEEGILEIFGVPLFAGFMYSAIGSYIARSWKIFSFSYTHFPPFWQLSLVSILIYLNFFTHHFVADFRILLFVAVFFLFHKSWIFFTIQEKPRKMPTLLSAFLLALFIWFAENLGTFANAWVYPEQIQMWQMVSFQKLGSWFLLMIISFTMVAWVYQKKQKDLIFPCLYKYTPFLGL